MRLKEHHWLIVGLGAAFFAVVYGGRLMRWTSTLGKPTSIQAIFPRAQVNNPDASAIVTPGAAFTLYNPLANSPGLF